MEAPSPKNARRQLKRLLDGKYKRDFALSILAGRWDCTPAEALAWMKIRQRGRKPKEEPTMADRPLACLVSREELVELIDHLIEDGMTRPQAKIATAKFYRMNMFSLNGMLHVEPQGCPTLEEVWLAAEKIRSGWSEGVLRRRAGIVPVEVATEFIKLADCG